MTTTNNNDDTIQQAAVDAAVRAYDNGATDTEVQRISTDAAEAMSGDSAMRGEGIRRAIAVSRRGHDGHRPPEDVQRIADAREAAAADIPTVCVTIARRVGQSVSDGNFGRRRTERAEAWLDRERTRANADNIGEPGGMRMVSVPPSVPHGTSRSDMRAMMDARSVPAGLDPENRYDVDSDTLEGFAGRRVVDVIHLPRPGDGDRAKEARLAIRAMGVKLEDILTDDEGYDVDKAFRVYAGGRAVFEIARFGKNRWGVNPCWPWAGPRVLWARRSLAILAMMESLAPGSTMIGGAS